MYKLIKPKRSSLYETRTHPHDSRSAQQRPNQLLHKHISESAPRRRLEKEEVTEEEEDYLNSNRIEVPEQPFGSVIQQQPEQPQLPVVPPIDLQTNLDAACDILNCDFTSGRF